jgi:hypothetical protein
MKVTPMQTVKQKFGGRSGLVDAILPMLDGADDDTRSRLMGTANKKLLRIHETATQVKDRFGSRKNLQETILKVRYPKGKPDDGFLKRMETATLKRLLEIHRQNVG